MNDLPYTEWDQYFMRNLESANKHIKLGRGSPGIQFLTDYIEKNKLYSSGERRRNILEVGCCCGYNLFYLQKSYGFDCVGIDPSKEAITYGKHIAQEKDIPVRFYVGTADLMPFEDESFDMVIIGFCLYCIDRRKLMRSISEIDRVLKTGGHIFLTDFDTSIPYKRPNKHCKDIYTYKMDYTKLFLADPQYTLCAKQPYTHKDLAFQREMQERLSASILYKEDEQDAYVCIDRRGMSGQHYKKARCRS